MVVVVLLLVLVLVVVLVVVLMVVLVLGLCIMLLDGTQAFSSFAQIACEALVTDLLRPLMAEVFQESPPADVRCPLAVRVVARRLAALTGARRRQSCKRLSRRS